MKYDAFISYRHLDKDIYVARKLHKALETLRIPGNIKKLTGKKRINRVFRDQEELPVGSDLGNNIFAALKESEYLIVICSPETSKSYWVMQEIDTFIAMHGRSNIIAVLAEGEPEDSFPPQILVDDLGNKVEPLAADVRGSSKKDILQKVKAESIRVAAAILGVDYDDLRQRHKERIVRRYIAIAAAMAVFGISFGVYNAYNLARINENYQQKLVNESKVMAEKSLDILASGDRKTAALVAMEALPSEDNGRPFVPEAMNALSKALNSYTIGTGFACDSILRGNMVLEDLAASRAGSDYVAAYDVGGNVYCWNADSGELITEIRSDQIKGLEYGTGDIAINENDNICFLTGDYLYVYNMDGETVYEVEFPENAWEVEFLYKGELAFVRYISLEPGNIGSYLNVYSTFTGECICSWKSPDYIEGDVFGVSQDKRYIATVLYSELGDNAVVGVYDTQTQEEYVLQCNSQAVCDISFTYDDSILVSTMPDGNALATNEPVNMWVQKFDFLNETVLWEQEIRYDLIGVHVTLPYLVPTEMEDGSKYDFVSSGVSLVCFDDETGEILSSYSSNTEIVSYFIGEDIAYVFTSAGEFEYLYYLNPSVRITSHLPEGVRQAVVGNGFILCRTSGSPNIMVVKPQQDIEDKMIGQLAGRPLSIQVPDNEDIYVISTWLIGGNSEESDESSELFGSEVCYTFYETDTDNVIAELTVDSAVHTRASFLDDDTFIIHGDDSILYYKVSTKQKEIVDCPHMDSYISSNNCRYIFCKDEKFYKVYDCLERKVLYSGVTGLDEEEDSSSFVDENKARMSVSDDGGRIYFTDQAFNVYMMDLVTGERVSISDLHANNLKLSPSGNLLAVAADDGLMHMFDAKTLKEKDILEISSGDKLFLAFSEDDKYLVVQGSDYYLKVYDLEKQKPIYISNERMDRIGGFLLDTEKNIMVLAPDNALIVFDLDDMGIMTNIDRGGFYFTKKNKVLVMTDYFIHGFNYKQLPDLIEEFHRQFGDATLTEEQKMMYRID